MKIKIYFKDLSYEKKIEILQAHKIDIDAFNDSNLDQLATKEDMKFLFPIATLNIKD